jgi:hypothetical protein
MSRPPLAAEQTYRSEGNQFIQLLRKIKPTLLKTPPLPDPPSSYTACIFFVSHFSQHVLCLDV